LDLNLAQLILDEAAIDIVLVGADLEIIEWTEGANQYAALALNKGSRLSDSFPTLSDSIPSLVKVLVGRLKYYNQPLVPSSEPGLYFSLTAHPYVIPGNNSAGLACLFKDASSNSALIREIESQKKEIQELIKVNSAFLAITSHELRAPLSNVRGFLEMVLDGSVGLLNERQKHFLGLADKNLNSLISLLNDMLDLERIESGTLQLELVNFDLIRLVRVMSENYTVDLQRRNLTLKIETPAEVDYTITADLTRIEQVINNLINNAIKYSHVGSGEIEITFEQDMGMAITHVRDRGIGIPEPDLPLLFRRFYRASNASIEGARGNGLGLSIVKSIIEQHGGKLWVESQAGEGSTFSFSLPLAPREVRSY
jgi:signal transduction histidine kinase